MKFYKHLKISVLIFITTVSFNAFSQETSRDTIDIDDVVTFLEQQTAADSTKSTTKHTITAETSPKPLTPKPISLSDKFISAKDSALIHKRAVKRRDENPLFIDWVFPFAANPDCFDTDDEALRTIQKNARTYILKNNAELFTYHQTELPKLQEITGWDDHFEITGVSVLDSVDLAFEPIRLNLPKPSPWLKYGRIQIQASQNYISDNWYKGGESNISILTMANGHINYDNKKNIQWENALEMKFGFNSAGSDTLRKIRTNEDLVKINSRLGIKAFGTWFYTADVEFSTQLFNTYVPNSRERTTGPFSPIRFYGSAGLNYKYKKMLSVLIAPFSYKLTAVADTSKADGVTLSIADKLGIEPGKNISHEFGSLVKVEFNHSFSRSINLESTLSFYTNYKGIEFDWEIIGNFIINRFLSARVSVRPRYDSTITLPNDEKAKLQFKELISLGFQYHF